ncbi:MAG: RIP metalloprotease RseP [Gemmatimonadetes bacterium]|nr:RIP metalloprotease RseP [Gemmatimonadota bacterium]
MTTLLATVVLLGVLIFVHELGHFWAAKAVGIGVERFSIGLGPRVWGFLRGETQYIISAIPLGGYVKMQGMEDEVMEHLEGGRSDGPRRRDPRDFDAKPLWPRAFVISAGVIMNMIFAVVAYGAAAAGWGFEELATTRVMAVADSTLPAGAEALAEIPPGAEIVQVGEVGTTTWTQVRRAFLEGPAGPVPVVTASPPARFEIRIPEATRDRRALAESLVSWVDPVVGTVEGGSPADEAAIESGDRVTSVAGAPVTNWSDLLREIGARPGERVEIGLLRDGTELLRVAELDVFDDEGGERGRLGVRPAPLETVNVRVGLGEAAVIGFRQTAWDTRRILGFLRDLVTLNVSPREVGSIGTIAIVSGEAASRGLATFLRFMALFSVNLAILNMLPIPVLDGGHMVFLGIELIRGEKLTVAQRVRWSQVGLWVVIGIMVWALGNDLLRFLGL